ncbi:MAG: hypothetical protein JNL42_10300, partial [Anaerolineae bacterium]|nr:hypothetical protein [Anaerolineae bacterium]
MQKYAERGTEQFALEVLPLSNFGTIGEIVQLFGGTDKLKSTFERQQ